jgi:hypothetical protein
MKARIKAPLGYSACRIWEIRLEKPQVLLYLEPKPVCSNCNSYLAEVQYKEWENSFAPNVGISFI